MGALSANTLFHYTRTKENLIGILKHNFRLQLCLEENVHSVNKTKWAVPMICFCDLPLSQISEHTQKYGSYALGLKKEWAIKNKIVPITYTYQDSPTTEIINSLSKLGTYGLVNKLPNEQLEKMIEDLQYTIIYNNFLHKSYKGIQKVNGRDEEVKFYDEREWRYTVPFNELTKNKNSFCLTNEKFALPSFKAGINQLLEKYSLKFEPKDINYIIVPTEEEILEIKDEVERIKDRFPHNDVKLLSTRILSMERIKEDF